MGRGHDSSEWVHAFAASASGSLCTLLPLHPRRPIARQPTIARMSRMAGRYIAPARAPLADAGAFPAFSQRSRQVAQTARTSPPAGADLGGRSATLEAWPIATTPLTSAK